MSSVNGNHPNNFLNNAPKTTATEKNEAAPGTGAGEKSTGSGTSMTGPSTAPDSHPGPALYLFNGITLTAAASSQLVGDGTTIIPGAPPAVIQGHKFSLAGQGAILAVDGTQTPLVRGLVPVATAGGGTLTDGLPTQTATKSLQTGSTKFPGPALYTFNQITLTAGPTGVLLSDGKSIMPGAAPAIISGHTFSLGSEGSSIAVDGKSSALSQGLVPAAADEAQKASVTATAESRTGVSSPQLFTFNGITFTGGAKGLTAGSLTVAPGGAPATISGHTFSLGAAGNSIMIDSAMSPLIGGAPITTAPITSDFMPRTFTLAGIALTAGASGLSAGSLTIAPGGPPATISGHTFSLPTAGSSILVDGVTSPLPAPAPVTAPLQTTSSSPDVYTLAGIAFTGGTAGLTDAGFTVGPGRAPVTMSGHTFSLPATGSSVVVDGTPSPLKVAATNTGAVPGSVPTGSVLQQSDRFGTNTATGSSLPGDGNGGTTAGSNIVAVPQGPQNTGTARVPASHPSTMAGGAIVYLPGAPGATVTAPGAVVTVDGGVAGDTAWPYTDLITGTVTALPSEASIEGYFHGSGTSSTNFWLTTKDDKGSTTIVPVIVGCPGCGAGIILWHFSPIPGVKFNIPKLPKFPTMPKLPTLNFPCVPIPILHPCPGPSPPECKDY